MRPPKRLPWEQLDGSLSPDWVVGLIAGLILVAAGLGVWINDMYTNGSGIFAR